MAQANTSHSPRSPHTLARQQRLTELLRVQNDLERGERIKELRERSHMTQPAIAERVGVTLRALQKWEEGGGLAWENLEALAELHGVTPQYIASGETPDLLRSLNGSVPQELQNQLDRIEASQQEVLGTLAAILTRMDLAATTPPTAAPATRQEAQTIPTAKTRKRGRAQAP